MTSPHKLIIGYIFIKCFINMNNYSLNPIVIYIVKVFVRDKMKCYSCKTEGYKKFYATNHGHIFKISLCESCEYVNKNLKSKLVLLSKYEQKILK